MNWRWYVGAAAYNAFHAVLSRSRFPLTRAVPSGLSWWYDAQRFAGNKRLDVLFDVGANVGQTVGGLLRYFPRASIYCFEPVSSAFAALNKAYSDRPNVRCYQMAIGASVGSGRIQLHRDSELNTLVNDGPRHDLTGESETVRVNTIDAFCAAEGIESIDVLKLDVQGWEMEVLRGARGILERRRVQYVFSEVGFRRADTDMQHFAEFNDAMEEAGFCLCGFYEPFRWGTHRAFVGFANALYMNPDYFRPASPPGR